MRNGFNRLDLIDREPDELWMEVHDIIQETGIKTIPKKKKYKKAKWLSREALQIAVKRKEFKSKEEKERYKHLNAEFQRIARRDKKAFLPHNVLGPGIDGRGIPRGPRATPMGTGISRGLQSGSLKTTSQVESTCRNSRKSRRFSPPGEMRPISAEASRG